MDASEATKIAIALANEFQDGNLTNAEGVLSIPRDTFSMIENEVVGEDSAERVILNKLNGTLGPETPFEKLAPEAIPTLDITLAERAIRTEALRREALDKTGVITRTFRFHGVKVAWVHGKSKRAKDGSTIRTVHLLLVDRTGSWEVDGIVDPEMASGLKPLRTNTHMKRFEDGPPASYTVNVEAEAYVEKKQDCNVGKVRARITEFVEEEITRPSPSREICSLVCRSPQLLTVVGVRGSVITLVPHCARDRDLILGIIGGAEGEGNIIRSQKDAFIEEVPRTRREWNIAIGPLYRYSKVFATPRGQYLSYGDAVMLCHEPFRDKYGTHAGFAVVIPVVVTYGAFRKHIAPTDGRHDPTPGEYPHGLVMVGNHLTEAELKAAVLSPPFQGKESLHERCGATLEDFTLALRVLGTPVLQRQVLEFCKESGLDVLDVVKIIPRRPFLEDGSDATSMVIEDESSLLTFLKICEAALSKKGKHQEGTRTFLFGAPELKTILGGKYKGRIESLHLHEFVREMGPEGYLFQFSEEAYGFLQERWKATANKKTEGECK